MRRYSRAMERELCKMFLRKTFRELNFRGSRRILCASAKTVKIMRLKKFGAHTCDKQKPVKLCTFFGSEAATAI